MKLVSILSLACVLAAAGCSSTSDTGTDGGTTGDTGSGGGDTGSGGGDTGTVNDTGTVQDTGTTGDASACQTCVTSHCNTELNACLADTTAHPNACSDGLNCLQACSKGDSTCENACVSSFGSNAPFTDLIGCINTNCKSECL